MAQDFTLSDFDYDLPDSLIAQEPVTPRDTSRLLVYYRDEDSIVDDYFYNLPAYLPSHTTLVLNNSKVEKCRLLFGNREIFVHKAYSNTLVEALVRPGKVFKKGKTVSLPNGIAATVKDVTDDGLRIIEFNHPFDDEKFDAYRYTPFPPYLEQNEELAPNYQTVFAKEEGSKAAPTAGLHFTESLFNKLEERGITREEITLHVGLGTFAPVKEEDLDRHTMHYEEYWLDEQTAGRLNEAEHITAVGTTSVRVLEGNSNENGKLTPKRDSTNLFIRPGYRFRAVDAMITNFHLPKSTLLMLVSAFMGYEQMLRVYRHAIEQEYRFYSFGDAMLIL